MVKVYSIQYWKVDPSEYTDGRWIDVKKEYSLSIPAGLSEARPTMEKSLGFGHKIRISLDVIHEFATVQEAEAFAAACNRTASW